jgi:tRNA A-37 threonylcarbamoyl transferase component Bud32
MLENAFSVENVGGRLRLVCESKAFKLEDAGRALANYLGMENVFDFAAVNLDDLMPGNSLDVFKLTIDGKRSFHVKLVDAPDPESVFISKVLELFPELASDQNVLVPQVIDVVDTSTGEAEYYIHVTMWKERATPLSVSLIKQWMTGRLKELERMLYAVGQFLRGFHGKYPGIMHNDMNPSNVLLVEQEGGLSFVLIDCAGLDDEVGDDCKTFLVALSVLAEGGFGERFLELATSAFLSGYDSSS